MSIQLIPNEIVKLTNGRFISGIGLTMINGVYVDDRKVTPGSLFIPLKNSRHASIEKAFQKGAVATLVSRDSKTSSRTFTNNPKKIFIEVEDTLLALLEMARFWRYKLGINFIAATGSKNSSKVKDLSYRLINSLKPAAEVPDSINSPIDQALFMMDLTAGFKKVMIRIDAAETEDMEKLIYTCEPSILMITDSEKKDLQSFTKIISSLEKEKTLILNADDISFTALKKVAQCTVVSFGTKKANLFPSEIKKEKDGKTEFVLNVYKDKTDITLNDPKEISISVFLAAAAAAHTAGLGIDEIKKGLEGVN